MATMTRSAAQTPERTRDALTTALLVFGVWLATAALVRVVHAAVDPLSPAGGAVVTMTAIVSAAWVYMRLSRNAGVEHALGVGIAWLALTILAEMLMTSRLGHGWYALLGSPVHPLLRNLNFFLWIFATAAFARRESTS
jgi:hypothetical protein